MTEPTITCPKCKEEIKLTESLAAPLIESTRREFEERLAKVQTMVGMYGDFQGIAGKTLQEIEGLELHALDAPKEEGKGLIEN